jgi:phosphate transport system protein
MDNRLIGQKLGKLKDKILLLGGATEQAVQLSMRSLKERDSELARQVLKGDEEIDRMELEIDRFCVEILALQQPAAHDLRFVIAAAKITPILERIADHAGSIAESALRINDEPEISERVYISAMSTIGAEMLKQALDAFTSEDAAASRAIIKRDEEIDAHYRKVFDQLVKMMTDDPATTSVTAQLLFVAKHLERIGDYVKDICELTVYMKEAVVIKHNPPGKFNV